jgi:hypothetical protein
MDRLSEHGTGSISGSWAGGNDTQLVRPYNGLLCGVAVIIKPVRRGLYEGKFQGIDAT